MTKSFIVAADSRKQSKAVRFRGYPQSTPAASMGKCAVVLTAPWIPKASMNAANRGQFTLYTVRCRVEIEDHFKVAKLFMRALYKAVDGHMPNGVCQIHLRPGYSFTEGVFGRLFLSPHGTPKDVAYRMSLDDGRVLLLRAKEDLTGMVLAVTPPPAESKPEPTAAPAEPKEDSISVLALWDAAGGNPHVMPTAERALALVRELRNRLAVCEGRVRRGPPPLKPNTLSEGSTGQGWPTTP
jgi:hypothetical protein